MYSTDFLVKQEKVAASWTLFGFHTQMPAFVMHCVGIKFYIYPINSILSFIHSFIVSIQFIPYNQKFPASVFLYRKSSHVES